MNETNKIPFGSPSSIKLIVQHSILNGNGTNWQNANCYKWIQHIATWLTIYVRLPLKKKLNDYTKTIMFWISDYNILASMMSNTFEHMFYVHFALWSQLRFLFFFTQTTDICFAVDENYSLNFFSILGENNENSNGLLIDEIPLSTAQVLRSIFRIIDKVIITWNKMNYFLTILWICSITSVGSAKSEWIILCV